MSRWFRHYAGMMRDEKLVAAAVRTKQPVERVLWIWGAILESAAEINDNGKFSLDAAEAAYFLRADEADLNDILSALEQLGRVAGQCVVAWGKRQFSSDRSAERTRNYRAKRQEPEGDTVHRTVTVEQCDSAVTSQQRHCDAPELDTEAEKIPEAIASGAQEPIYTDSKHELWGEGVPILGQLGLNERSARSNIGRWLKSSKDDAQVVLGAIQRARDGRIIDPVPWITRALTSGNANVQATHPGGAYGASKDRFREAFDELKAYNRRGDTGDGTAVGFLPAVGRDRA